AVSATHHHLLPAQRLPGKTNARSNVVIIRRNLRSIDSGCQSRSVLHGRLLHRLPVVANPEVQGQAVAHAVVVLHEVSLLELVRMRGCSGCSRSRKRLEEGVAGCRNRLSQEAAPEIIKTGEGVGAREVSGKEVE